MALALAKSRQYPQHYALTSLEAKPTAGVPYGATTYETDTGLWYIFTAAGWVQETLPAIAATIAGPVAISSIAAGDNNIGNVDVASIAAGETHIGEVGANTTLVSCTPTVTAGAYHANDVVGGIQTIANAVRVSAGTGIIQSLTISDLAAQKAVFEIYLFSATPGTGTYTNNSAMDLDDTDALLCIGRIDVTEADYKSLADNSIAMIRNIGIPIKVAATSLFVVIRTTGTPTYTSTSDLKFTFGILRD